MLDQNASTPLYEQLKNAIRKEIDEKKYSSGDRMPSEAELEKLYNVSRITVRRAIKELCDEEVLVRRQGKGTFVIGEENRARLDCGVEGFHESIRKNGRSVSSEIVDKQIIKVTASYARDLEIDWMMRLFI
ncbi:MAG: GntR family transcriptional regulator [Lachnospiraceae bacterium]